MDKQSKLLKMQRKLKELEKEELTLNGSISTLLESLKGDLGDLTLSDNEVSKAVQNKIKHLKSKMEKAKEQFTQKMEQIEEMADILE